MRIYEFAKEIGVPAKRLMQVLQEHGVQVKSHMALLADQEKSLLIKLFAGEKLKSSLQGVHDAPGEINKNNVRKSEPKEMSVKQEIRSNTSQKTPTISPEPPRVGAVVTPQPQQA